VALQALKVDLTYTKQPRVRRSMRSMATATPVGLHWYVFINERTSLIGMALDTGGIAVRHSPHLTKSGSAMNVVTVNTLNQSLVYAMMERFKEVRLRGSMAPIAELRLFFSQQMLGFFSVVRGMTIEAADVAISMCGAGNISMLVVLAVAGKASSVSFLSRQHLKADDLCNVAITRNVFGTRSMARLATTMFVPKSCFEVRSVLEVLLVEILVTCLARI